jgi:hypothetical protein
LPAPHVPNRTADFIRDAENQIMMQSYAASMFDQIVSSPLSMVLTKIAFSVFFSSVVIAVSDWYIKDKTVEWESSVKELEAIFVLRDPR